MRKSMPQNRMTIQRRIIIEELKQHNSHPTAEQLYHIVRESLPRISLGTIYRNLDFLSKNNIIRKLDIDKEQARYDAVIKEHYHVRCIRCGKIGDIFNLPKTDIEKEVGKLTDFVIVDYLPEFKGICPECINKTKSEELKSITEDKKENI
ncbi:MAG: transcriptional repressor [candidate division Zixibacteria bacterium]|nr:transcriptional repressor [candidate division Zixibacteria bacterium]